MESGPAPAQRPVGAEGCRRLALSDLAFRSKITSRRRRTLLSPACAVSEVGAGVLAEPGDAEEPRQGKHPILCSRQMMRIGVDYRSDFRSGYLSYRALVQAPEPDAVGMAAGRPDERRVELGVALHLAEVLLHSFLDTLPSPLPSVLLCNPAGQPVERHRTFTFDNARDHLPQRKGVDVVEELRGIRNDILHRRAGLLSRRRGTPVYTNLNLLNRLVSVRQLALIAVSFWVYRSRGLATGLRMPHEVGPVPF